MPERGRPVLRAQSRRRQPLRVQPEPLRDVAHDRRAVAHEVVEPHDLHGVPAEHVPPVGQPVRVPTTGDRHELLGLGVAPDRVAERVGGCEVLVEGELGGEPEPDLLVLEERDRARHRLPEHQHDPRTLQHSLHRAGHGGAAVEVRRGRLEAHRPIRGGGEVALPHAGRFERLAVARGQEVAGLLDRRRDDVGMLRERHEQRGGPRLVHPGDDRVDPLHPGSVRSVRSRGSRAARSRARRSRGGTSRTRRGCAAGGRSPTSGPTRSRRGRRRRTRRAG